MEINPNEQAKSVVLEFVNQMNNWETKMYIFSRISNQQIISKENQQLISEDTKESLNLLYYKILEKFCTEKKRVYGGHPHSFGKPTKYSGITEQKILEVNQTKTTRIEVVAESNYFSKTIYLFVLLKTRDGWKIDNLKIKSDNKWRNSLL